MILVLEIGWYTGYSVHGVWYTGCLVYRVFGIQGIVYSVFGIQGLVYRVGAYMGAYMQYKSIKLVFFVSIVFFKKLKSTHMFKKR